MANMALNIEQMIGQKVTPEQQTIWNYLATLGTITRIDIIGFTANAMPAEFGTYAANKMYFGYKLITGNLTGIGPIPSVIVYNELNVAAYYLAKHLVYWDATAAAARHEAITAIWNNIIGSRFQNNGINLLQFIGYRITY